MRNLTASLFLILGIVVCALAQRPLVSVVGEAELNVQPDQALLTLEVVSLDKDLVAAKKVNDEIVSKTLAVTRSYQIQPQDVQTVNFSIAPKYSTTNEKRERTFIGYEISKQISITLRDLNKIESFLESVLASGVDKITSVEFQSSQMRKYQEQVRAMAVKNAQEKARAYAQQLGQNIGKAYSITEEGAEVAAYGVGNGNGSGNGDGIGNDSDDAPNEITTIGGKNVISRGVTFAVGQIKIEERIIVSFLLE